jgi:hypothetical protein
MLHMFSTCVCMFTNHFPQPWNHADLESAIFHPNGMNTTKRYASIQMVHSNSINNISYIYIYIYLIYIYMYIPEIIPYHTIYMYIHLLYLLILYIHIPYIVYIYIYTYYILYCMNIPSCHGWIRVRRPRKRRGAWRPCSARPTPGAPGRRWNREGRRKAEPGWRFMVQITWQCVKTLYPCSSHQNSWDLWMFIPLKMVLIGIDPYPLTGA